MQRLGIDTGGTFTDFVLQTSDGIRTHKLPSTPDDPSRAILAGLAFFFPDGLPENLEIIHGTTVGTNAFLERKGARTVLFTTRGFEDVLFIGRQNRARLYDFLITRPPEIVPRSRVTGVGERMLFDGTVQTPLPRFAGKRLRAFCRKTGAESVAICLLHAYANPIHEEELARELTSLSIPVTRSSDILPEFREYERLSTTLINAYLTPVVSAYIRRLDAAIKGAPLFIQQSGGGILPAADIGDRAVHTLLSGPAGGVQGAFRLSRALGEKRIITFDMGGTSTDVSLCDGAPSFTREYAIDGFPVRIRVLDIHTVGAGGGSIARVDAGGFLQVGPESAGADPGPVCYGKGEHLTVTDANLFLRRIPERLLGGNLRLDRNRVHARMAALAETLSLTPEQTALGIIRLANVGMAGAVRAVSLERGHDPRDFTLFAFGGASGLHVCELARDLGMRRIILPARAGVLSAQGMVSGSPGMEVTAPLFLRGDQLTPEALRASFADLEAKGRAALGSLASGDLIVEHFLDLRYQGQSYELTIPGGNDFAERFHQSHAFQFGYRLDHLPLELTTIRAVLTVARSRLSLPEMPERAGSPPEHEGVDAIWFNGEEPTPTPFFSRHRLLPGHVICGPALVTEEHTTLLLPQGCELTVDLHGNLVIQLF